MKKLISSVLIFAAIMLFTGCQNTKTDLSDTVTFYYIHNEPAYGTLHGIMAANVIELDDPQPNYDVLLDQYLGGHADEDCISPFPSGTKLENLEIGNEKAQLVLSPHMSALSGADLTVAFACLTRTVIELTDVKTVQIKIMDNQINGSDFVTFTLNSFAQYDEVQPQSGR